MQVWIQHEPDPPELFVVYVANEGEPGRRVSQHETREAANAAKARLRERYDDDARALAENNEQRDYAEERFNEQLLREE